MSVPSGCCTTRACARSRSRSWWAPRAAAPTNCRRRPSSASPASSASTGRSTTRSPRSCSGAIRSPSSRDRSAHGGRRSARRSKTLQRNASARRSSCTAMNSWDSRLVACLDDGPPDIGALWEICMSFEFDREQTADGIAAWLGPPAGRRILDSACGSGFPALELIARGYDVTCADGSELMLRHFRLNATLAGLRVQAVQALWSQLPDRFGEKFDVVLNRGGG